MTPARGTLLFLDHVRRAPLSELGPVKVVREGADAAFLLDRFHAERRILATLDHPNLAKLLDAGISSEGAHYVVMDLVDGGQAIDAYCEAHALPLDARLRLFRTVCQVVDYAHRQGFQLSGIFTMDGSKRSTKANAFFTGFGGFEKALKFHDVCARYASEKQPPLYPRDS